MSGTEQPVSEAVGETTVKRLLADSGIAVPAGTSARLRTGVTAVLESVERAQLPEPFVVKLTGPGLVHKTELGAVRVGVPMRRLRDTVGELRELAGRAGVEATGEILVDELVGGGVEFLAGMTVDRSFGRIGVLGLGGVAAEVHPGMRCAALPLTTPGAVERFVAPFRQPLRRMNAVGAFIDLVTKLMAPDGMMLRPEIVELDLNPVLVTRNRVVVVDGWARTGRADQYPWASARGRSSMFDRLFRPRSVVVAGASPRRLNPGRDFIDRQRDFGYRGDIFVVRENGTDIPGATVVRSWADIPGRVDYGFVAVPAEHVPEVIDEWTGCVSFVQVLSSGFGELGDAGGAVEHRIVDRARDGGTRIIGPNSWGIYSPSGGLTFGGPLSDRAGGLAVVSQSGAIAVEVVMRVARTGGRFWGAVAIGNARAILAAQTT